jgi:hypothetical protein
VQIFFTNICCADCTSATSFPSRRISSQFAGFVILFSLPSRRVRTGDVSCRSFARRLSLDRADDYRREKTRERTASRREERLRTRLLLYPHIFISLSHLSHLLTTLATSAISLYYFSQALSRLRQNRPVRARFNRSRESISDRSSRLDRSIPTIQHSLSRSLRGKRESAPVSFARSLTPASRDLVTPFSLACLRVRGPPYPLTSPPQPPPPAPAPAPRHA